MNRRTVLTGLSVVAAVPLMSLSVSAGSGDGALLRLYRQARAREDAAAASIVDDDALSEALEPVWDAYVEVATAKAGGLADVRAKLELFRYVKIEQGSDVGWFEDCLDTALGALPK